MLPPPDKYFYKTPEIFIRSFKLFRAYPAFHQALSSDVILEISSLIFYHVPLSNRLYFRKDSDRSPPVVK